jgi:hypothetical protein
MRVVFTARRMRHDLEAIQTRSTSRRDRSRGTWCWWCLRAPTLLAHVHRGVDVRVGEEAERVRPDLQPTERREGPRSTRAVDLTVSACVAVLAP